MLMISLLVEMSTPLSSQYVPNQLRKMKCRTGVKINHCTNIAHTFCKKLRIFASAESFLKLLDFGYSEFLTSFFKTR